MGNIAGDPFSAGASVINGLFGLYTSHRDRQQDWRIAQLNYQSQQETNEVNKQIAADANANMMAMQRENNQFNAEQAQIAREWDSAGARFQRAIDAGLNPYVAASQALGSGSAQMATAAGAGAQLHAPQLVAPRYDMVQSRYSRMAEISGQMAQAVASLAQARKAGADSKRVNKLLDKELDLYDANVAKTRADAKISEVSEDIMLATKDFQIAKSEYEKDQSYETLQNLRKERVRIQQQCNLLIQQVAESQANTDLIYQKVGTESVQREYLAEQINHLQNLDEFNRQQLGILAYNAQTQRYSASIQEYAVKNPQTLEAFLIRLVSGGFGSDAEQLGKNIVSWLQKYTPKVIDAWKKKPSMPLFGLLGLFL